MIDHLIEFGNIGTHLGTRFAGASVREKIERIFNTTDKFIFDFTGVETVSNSFADECFGKLLLKFEFEEIKNKTTFKNADPFIKAVIGNAYKERIPKEIPKEFTKEGD